MTTATPTAAPTVSGLLRSLAGTGRDAARGGWSRHAFDDAEVDLRSWFTEQARARGMEVETDRNANLWAWWRPAGTQGRRAVVTGSHLDSVPGGGQFDGPLGVACALVALDQLRARGVVPRRPLAIVVPVEEEGGRFGVACLGSRLLTGASEAAHVLGLTDPGGTTFADAARWVGFDPAGFGADPQRLAGLECFVELHVEQGRGLVDLGEPVALASSVLAHGRWRLRFTGEGNHAGATPMSDRHDPVLPAAATVLAARAAAAAHDGPASPLRATVGRLVPVPGGTNVVASSVDLHLDARGSGDGRTRALVAEIVAAARASAAQEGCAVSVQEQAYTGEVHFDAPLRERLAAVLGAPDALARTGAATVPVLATGAGHDAAVIAGAPRVGALPVPTAMLFVRNPSGVSHAPGEHAEDDDCERGAAALADVLADLLTAQGLTA